MTQPATQPDAAAALAYIESHRTEAGGFTREDLEHIGVSWPPPTGWLAGLRAAATQPTETAKPEPHVCPWCDGTTRDPHGRRSSCPYCDEGLTFAWFCGVCGCEHDVRKSTYYPQGIDRPHKTPRMIDYTVGRRRSVLCDFCAPHEAIGDGAGLRAMLSDVRALRQALAMTVQAISFVDRPKHLGFANGYAASVETALLDLCAQCGVAHDEASRAKAADAEAGR